MGKKRAREESGAVDKEVPTVREENRDTPRSDKKQKKNAAKSSKVDSTGDAVAGSVDGKGDNDAGAVPHGKKKSRQPPAGSGGGALDAAAAPAAADCGKGSDGTSAAAASKKGGEEDSKLRGYFNAETKEWQWDLKEDLKLRVTKFKGNTYVDIRKTWNGKHTQKGVCIPIDLFREIQSWQGLDEALKVVEKGSA